MAGIRGLCVNCILNEQHSQLDHPCIDKEAKLYRNCFNRIECEQLLRVDSATIIQKVLDSGCLACNFTREMRRIIEVRLRGISDHLKATQIQSKRRRHQ